MRPRRHAIAAVIALSAGLAGCERNDMHNQPRHEPMEVSAFFDDGQSSRPIVAGTVARGQLMSVDMRYAGPRPEGAEAPDTFPFEITKADLKRGKQRFDIYCSVCHGATGDGDGMIVQRGFAKPPSFHEQRLKDAPAGHFFDVITNGWGAMYSYNDRVFPEDRWRIAAYIRVLQLSQNDAVAAAAPAAPATRPTTPTTPTQK
jgi:mono/diheme cytochrome c family protein